MEPPGIREFSLQLSHPPGGETEAERGQGPRAPVRVVLLWFSARGLLDGNLYILRY